MSVFISLVLFSGITANALSHRIPERGTDCSWAASGKNRTLYGTQMVLMEASYTCKPDTGLHIVSSTCGDCNGPHGPSTTMPILGGTNYIPARKGAIRNPCRHEWHRKYIYDHSQIWRAHGFPIRGPYLAFMWVSYIRIRPNYARFAKLNIWTILICTCGASYVQVLTSFWVTPGPHMGPVWYYKTLKS